VHRVIQGLLVDRELKEPLGYRVLKVHKDLLGTKVHREQQEPKVPQAHKVI
jgi:hypothetical protein